MVDTSVDFDKVLVPGQIIKPDVSIDTAQKLIQDNFGYNVKRIKELNSYDDKNFYVEATKENSEIQKFVFKVLNSLDSGKEHAAAENKAMIFLKSKGISCPVPQESIQNIRSTCPKVNISGSIDSENNDSGEPIEKQHIVRLLSFVEGRILYEVPVTKPLLFQVGSFSGQILNYLKDFSDPGLKNYRSIWMLAATPYIENFLYVIQSEPEKYKMVSETLEAFNERVVFAYPHLEKGVIHGDFNEQNILVKASLENDLIGGSGHAEKEYEFAGIIDFGDMQESYYVFELGVMLTYMMLECLKTDIDPLEGSAYALAGFLQERDVPKIEFEIIRICIAARLCQSLVLGRYSHTLDPKNDYVLTTARKGWDLLDRIWNRTSDDQLFSIWRKNIPNFKL